MLEPRLSSESRRSEEEICKETDRLTGSDGEVEICQASGTKSRAAVRGLRMRWFDCLRWSQRHAVPKETSFGEDGTNAVPKTTRAATAYLDGLRGIAALAVVSQHTQQWVQYDYGQNLKILEMPFGWNGNHYLACLPGVQLMFRGGDPAVSLFFIMSGYVLANKPCKLVAARQQDKLADHMGSAMFRRWFRLFLPIFAVDFIWMTSWYLGVHNLRPNAPPPSSTYWGELKRYSLILSDLSDFFGGKKLDAVYNIPTWTIPDEFQGSMVIYVCIIALAQFTTEARLLCAITLCVYFLSLNHTPVALFLAGMIICQIDMITRGNNSVKHWRLFSAAKRWSGIFWYIPFMVGVYLSGLSEATMPSHDVWKRYHFVAACSLMISIPRISWIKSVLEHRSCQFLGRISYAMYLTHLPLLWMVGARIFAFFGRFRGNHEVFGSLSSVVPVSGAGPLGLQLNVLVPGVLWFAMCFGIGELATRFIDEPSVRFAQWLFQKGKADAETTLPQHVELGALSTEQPASILNYTDVIGHRQT